MRLAHPLFSRPIRWEENRIPILVVEEPVAYREMLFALQSQSEGENGPFVLSLNFEPLDCGVHLQVLSDYFHLPLESRRLNNQFQMLLQRTLQESFPEQVYNLNQEIQNFLSLLSLELEHPVSFAQVDYVASLLKALKVQPSITEDSAVERLMQYLDLFFSLLPDQCFVLVGARMLFADDELLELYRIAEYKKWRLLLLEHRQPQKQLRAEQYYVLDRDLCELRLDIDRELE